MTVNLNMVRIKCTVLVRMCINSVRKKAGVLGSLQGTRAYLE